MIRHSLPVVLLLVFFALAITCARGDSPTMDEQNHIARGLTFIRTGDPRLSVEHPPLVNSLSALPLLSLPVQLPFDDWSWDQSEWYRFADQLLWYANQNADQIVFVARLPIICMGLILGAILYKSAKSLFQSSSIALLALALYTFDPNLLAHAHYATNDLGFTFFILMAAMALWWASQREYRTGPVIVAGAAYGLAMGSKFSALVFCPIFGLMVFIDLILCWRQKKGSLLSFGMDAFRIAALYGFSALLVVWALYGFHTGYLNGNGVQIPMPLFWQGIGVISTFSTGGRPAFLMGRFSTEGFVAYFPIAFGLKTPIPVLILFIWSLAVFVKKVFSSKKVNITIRAGFFLLIPPVVYFAVSCFSALNLGYRHLLPILPFLYLFIAGNLPLGRINNTENKKWILSDRLTVPDTMIVILIVWLLVGDINIYPHFTSYFNEIIGPGNGYQALVDSNIDWGQDLKRLKTWMDENEYGRIKLAWFGTAPPSYYGIDYEPLPGLPHHFDLWDNLPFDPSNPEPGIYVISVSILEELFRTVEDKTAFSWFRARIPDDRVGYSLLVYYIRGH
ncbi:MAG: phospholipid carrier-dependent glycosyltransferase [Anaerolineales bacterium]|nr:phospholipid carrier-dependent glycosyltransferase [Anaerolineales bacterium]